LEELPVAPQASAQAPTKAETKAIQKRDHQLLNGLKIQLQPIMDQINRKYKKFRQPVISQGQIDYLFAESDPNYVRPDVAEAQVRPFEIVKDKYGNDVLRDTEGRCFYNLETTTIEERLSNGFYARPKDFLFDIKALARDAKNIGDKERTLKANELLSNVEVDVASIENSTAHIDWEALYRRQRERAAAAAEKERKKKAMQSIVDRVQSDIGGNDSDSQGPVILGEPVPGGRTQARFQLRTSPEKEAISQGPSSHPLSNGTSHAAVESDVQMSGVDDSHQESNVSDMGPPPRSQDASNAATGMTQISQKSAVTALPPGVSPSAVINDASTTKTSDPSTHRSSNWSTQVTNGTHEEARQEASEQDIDIPDTLPVESQNTTSDEPWPHSQAKALVQGIATAQVSNLSSSPASSQYHRSSGGSAGSKPHGMGALLNDTSAEEPSSIRNSGSSASQPYSVEGAVENFLNQVTDFTSGCTIEQLEQINRDLMDEIWRTRHEWNRNTVLDCVVRVFNNTMSDIEDLQGMGPQSQRENLDD
jgi:ATPase family AAA domain-containing protein 2